MVSDHQFLPDRSGGRESSIHELACLLKRTGHHVTVLAREHGFDGARSSILGDWWLSDLVRHLRTRSLGETLRLYTERFTWKAPYPVIRTHDVIGHMDTLLEEGKYERAIISVHWPHKVLDTASSHAHRYTVCVRDVEELDDMDHLSFPPHVTIVANSEFCAHQVARRIGRPVHAVEPYVERGNYVTAPTGKYVTFVNPVEVKGLALAIEIARACPDIPFLFLEGWPLSHEQFVKLRNMLAGAANVTLRRRVQDMRSTYRQTRVLLVPSQWEEAWARVVVEAQFSGIPAVASNVGGLAKNVADAGLVLGAKTPADAWAEAVRSLWREGAAYDKASECARRRAEAYWNAAASNALRLAELSSA